ncbi:pyrimidine reductase family protein [Rhodococcus sp. HNM0569]|uniref:pyrimidine reductase family protein n=1 Tax=Rhodococcus sp. HNM0569 TaxID=2716340 RepID=UPI00197F04E9|nr:pyrimidine reductase family protein [Rhodococcus sp. HNM0569]
MTYATYLTPDSPETPHDAEPSPRGLSDDELRAVYAYPAVDRPWVRVNFVASVDGAIAVDGASGALGTPADKKIFGLLRQLSDAVVVGAGTVRTENYGGVRTSDAARALRTARGQTPVPPIVVVSSQAMVDPASRLLTDTSTPPIVATTAAADAVRVADLRAAGAEVVVLGDSVVDSARLVDHLARRGMTRILCEGGPSLFGAMIAENVVDELCLTTSPLLVGGAGARIAVSTESVRTPMRPAAMLVDDDGTVLTRWVRADTEDAHLAG